MTSDPPARGEFRIESSDSREKPVVANASEIKVRERAGLWRISFTLGGVLCIVMAVVAIATFSHASLERLSFVLLAGGIVFVASVTPIWLKSLLSNGGNYQLSIIAFRILVMLPALAWGLTQTGATRNSFLTALLACYFVILPLESWLLVRDASPRDPR